MNRTSLHLPDSTLVLLFSCFRSSPFSPVVRSPVIAVVRCLGELESSMPRRRTRKPRSVSSLSDSWERIEGWLRDSAPELADTLQAACTITQLGKTEANIGVSLPDDFKASYRIHDGQEYDAPGFIPESMSGYQDCPYGFLSLEGIVDQWRPLKKLIDKGDFADADARARPSRGIAKVWWHSGWIPFASNGGGDHYCIDVAPSAAGNVGQVIVVWHDNPVRHLIADSFSDFLWRLAEALTSGRYRSSDEWEGGLVKRRVRDFPYCGRNS